MTVLAVRVRRVDPPQFVAEDLGDLEAGEWSGEQCDACGCSAYVVEVKPAGDPAKVTGWQVRCAGDPDLADEYERQGADAAQVATVRDGCGATYPLRWMSDDDVCF